MEIRCADCGCLPSECEIAFHPENVSTVHGRNVVAGGLLYTHPSTAIRFEEIIGSRFRSNL